MPSQQENNDLNSTKQQLISNLTKEQIKVLSREELNDYLQYFSPEQSSYLEPSQIKYLTRFNDNNKVWTFGPDTLRLLSPEQIQAIKPESLWKSLVKDNKLNAESLTEGLLSLFSKDQLEYFYDKEFFNFITKEHFSWL